MWQRVLPWRWPAKIIADRIKPGLRRLLPWGSLIGWASWIWLSHPAWAWGVQWHRVASETQSLQQQFVDLDSLQDLGNGRVRVKSYYLDRRSWPAVKTTYVTDYDCPHRQFRDGASDGPIDSLGWQSVDPDPLNQATMEFTCARVGYGMGSLSQAKN